MNRTACLLFALGLLTACFDGTPTRKTDLASEIPTMSCERLTSERLYQYRVLAHLKDPTDQSAAGAVATTALTLGYNIASNYGEESDRDERRSAINHTIALIESTQAQKGCTP